MSIKLKELEARLAQIQDEIAAAKESQKQANKRLGEARTAATREAVSRIAGEIRELHIEREAIHDEINDIRSELESEAGKRRTETARKILQVDLPSQQGKTLKAAKKLDAACALLAKAATELQAEKSTFENLLVSFYKLSHRHDTHCLAGHRRLQLAHGNNALGDPVMGYADSVRDLLSGVDEALARAENRALNHVEKATEQSIELATTAAQKLGLILAGTADD